MKILLALLLAPLAGCASCPPFSSDTCAPKSTRCRGQVAEICGPNGHWVVLMDCAGLSGGDWTCSPTDAGHTCLPRR